MSDNSENKEMGVVSLLLATLFCLALAGSGAFLYYQQTSEIHAAKKTEATVISSGYNMGSDDWVVKITYNYTVGGHTYRSDDVYPGNTPEKSLSKVKKIANQYPEGETVTAYYNPDTPSNSFLIKEKNTLLWVLLGGFGGFMALLFGTNLSRKIL